MGVTYTYVESMAFVPQKNKTGFAGSKGLPRPGCAASLKSPLQFQNLLTCTAERRSPTRRSGGIARVGLGLESAELKKGLRGMLDGPSGGLSTVKHLQPHLPVLFLPLRKPPQSNILAGGSV